MKIAKKPEARLVITLRLLKNTKERNAEQRNAYLQSVIACFRVKWLLYFFVKFKNLSNVLILVSTSFSSKT